MPRSLVTHEERLRTAEQPAPVPPQVHASHAGVLALQRSAGNRAVAGALGKRVIARMRSFTDFLGEKGGLPTALTYRDYRINVGFVKEVEEALKDRTRSAANRGAIETLQTAIQGALTAKEMNALVNAVDGIALVITDRAKTISDVPGWGEEEVIAQPAHEAAAPEPDADGAPAPLAGYRIRSIVKAGFKTKLSNKQQTALMGLWNDALTLGRLDPGRERSEILKAASGAILPDSHVRLDGEAVEANGRYQVFRIQGVNNKYPVLGGLYLQLGVVFTPEALREGFAVALRLAHQNQYAVLYDGGEYRAPG